MDINFIIIRSIKDSSQERMYPTIPLGLYESKRTADLKAAALNHQWPKYTYTVYALIPQL